MGTKQLATEKTNGSTRKSKRKFKNMETNYNENKTIQNLWDAEKAVVRGKCIAIGAFLKREEKSQINNLTQHLSELEKEEQTKPKVSRRKEIVNIKEEINKIEIQKNNRKESNQELVL